MSVAKSIHKSLVIFQSKSYLNGVDISKSVCNIQTFDWYWQVEPESL